MAGTVMNTRNGNGPNTSRYTGLVTRPDLGSHSLTLLFLSLPLPSTMTSSISKFYTLPYYVTYWLPQIKAKIIF